MQFTRLRLKNWRNFTKVDLELRDRLFVTGPNASGKSNLLDAFRFLRDIAKSGGGRREHGAMPRNPAPKNTCVAKRRRSLSGGLRPARRSP